jgi:hypothetical protein
VVVKANWRDNPWAAVSKPPAERNRGMEDQVRKRIDEIKSVSPDNLDENGGGNQIVKRRPVATL